MKTLNLLLQPHNLIVPLKKEIVFDQ